MIRLAQNKTIKSIAKEVILFIIGGLTYVFMEMLFRGYSHISMFFVGGIAFLLIGEINEIPKLKNLPLFYQMGLGSIIITLIELISGYILNIRLGLNVWDYSGLPFNFHGQICLYFSVLWFFVSLIAILLDDYIRYRFFGQSKAEYKLFCKYF